MRRTILTLIAVCLIVTLYNPVFAGLFDTETTGVVISHGEIEMVIGTTEQLTARVEPENATNKNINWVSSDEGIVTVRSTGLSSAEIRAEGCGEAWITVITEENDWRASCKVTVTIPVSNVFMKKIELSLKPGDEHQFEVFIEPEDATNPVLNWSSSDNFVVSVDENGLAEALSPGTARVIARSDEDDNLYAYCTVKVGEEVEEEPAEKESAETDNQNLYNEEEVEDELDEAAEAVDTSDEEQALDLDYALVAVGVVIVLLVIVLITVIVKKRR